MLFGCGNSLLLLCGMGLASASIAQGLFRCGATFQDKPCESAAVQQSFSRSTGSFTQEQVNPGTNARCAKTGLEAERIAKIRDAGRSREDYFAEIDARKTPRLEREKEKDFVADVYRRQGPALKVRAAIELDCMDSEKPEPVLSRSRGSRSVSARPYGDSYGTALLERDARIAEAEATAAERRAAQLAERRRNATR